MGHKHAVKMMEYAEDSAKHDRPWTQWECLNHGEDLWTEMVEHPRWHLQTEYRRKPETVTITVNGREFKLPRWETKKPGKEEKIFYLTGRVQGGVEDSTWSDDVIDNQWLASKILHLSRENALEWVKLWRFITGGGE